jgi:pimeloyl-ACP methyl ester carboxylesterase
MDKRDKWLLAGAAMAAAYALVRAKSAQAERQLPPSGTFIDVDGVRLHYIDRGKGPVVLLLHGNAGLAQDFEAAGLVDRLAAGYRVIAFDRPGFGYSTRPRGRLWTVDHQAQLLLRALRKLDVADCLVFAHSWGTLVGMAMAALDPGAVRGLVLASDITIRASGSTCICRPARRYRCWAISCALPSRHCYPGCWRHSRPGACSARRRCR